MPPSTYISGCGHQSCQVTMTRKGGCCRLVERPVAPPLLTPPNKKVNIEINKQDHQSQPGLPQLGSSLSSSREDRKAGSSWLPQSVACWEGEASGSTRSGPGQFPGQTARPSSLGRSGIRSLKRRNIGKENKSDRSRGCEHCNSQKPETDNSAILLSVQPQMCPLLTPTAGLPGSNFSALAQGKSPTTSQHQTQGHAQPTAEQRAEH